MVGSFQQKIYNNVHAHARFQAGPAPDMAINFFQQSALICIKRGAKLAAAGSQKPTRTHRFYAPAGCLRGEGQRLEAINIF
jgi:hypothetical protein